MVRNGRKPLSAPHITPATRGRTHWAYRATGRAIHNGHSLCALTFTLSPEGRESEALRADRFLPGTKSVGPAPFPPQGYTYINLSTIKSILIHDPGSKRTREWWERRRGGVGRLRCLLRREGARRQPRPRAWHFNKRLLQCPVWYNNRVTPLLVSSFLPKPRGPSAHP